MNCPSCGAPMHPHGDTLVCDFCHNVVVPDANDDGVSVLDEAPGQSCPICSNLPLMQATLAKLPLLYCSKCRGMLVSMEEFETLIDALRATQRGSIIQPPMDPGDLNRRINCPKCHGPMEAHSYCGPGNVVIDSCEPCSLNWLDHGQLARIAQAPDDRGPDADYRDPDADTDADADEGKIADAFGLSRGADCGGGVASGAINMRIGKWIVFVAIAAIPALTSCRKMPSSPKSLGQQQPIAAHAEPPIAQKTNVAHVETERGQSKDERSCQEFVHKFYDWYVHGVWSSFCNHGLDSESCKKVAEFDSVDEMSMKQVQSPKLEKLFEDDRAAEAAANDDGVGYLEDSDPYITGNGGPSSYYEVENVRVKDGVCNADVYGESKEGAKESKIMPELAKTGGKWVFVNFHYHYDFYDQRAKKEVSYDDDLVSGLTKDLKSYRDEIKNSKK